MEPILISELKERQGEGTKSLSNNPTQKYSQNFAKQSPPNVMDLVFHHYWQNGCPQVWYLHSSSRETKHPFLYSEWYLVKNRGRIALHSSFLLELAKLETAQLSFSSCSVFLGAKT